VILPPLRQCYLRTAQGVPVAAVSPAAARRYARQVADEAVAAALAKERARRTRWGLLFRWSSLWIGAHWSPQNRRWCVNLVPCVTLWIALPGGLTP